jgi:hypothetical protein
MPHLGMIIEFLSYAKAIAAFEPKQKLKVAGRDIIDDCTARAFC